MNIFDFVKGLVPHIEKNTVLEDLRITIKEIDEVLSDSYSLSADAFRVNKLKSDDVLEMQKVFYRHMDMNGVSKQPSFIAEVSIRLINLKENAKYVSEQIEKIFERDVMSVGLTAKKAMYIRAAENISFIVRFSADLLNYVYSKEAVNLDKDVGEDCKLSPAAAKYVEKNIVNMARLLGDYGIANDKFKKVFLEIPDVYVAGDNAALSSGFIGNKNMMFDTPLTAGFVGNPIYHIRLIIADWQDRRYKSNKEKKKVLELRLLHLKALQDKKYDSKIEKEIKYTQDRIDNYDIWLREQEESVGMNSE